MRKNLVRTGLTAAVVLGLSLAASPAFATPPGPGVTGTIISQTTIGSKDYILRQVTVPPGQSTGWHYHDGVLFGFVEKGTLSHFDSTCQSDGVYKAGSTLTEPSGPNHVHIGRNLGDVPLVLDVLYVLPHGAPLSEDAPNPGCDFQ
ncbi:cupin domain-containing protein [Streptomyces sp. NPDC001530]|uniref:cupin domain-containing protein n=1 Tax=Streptomyces sp. NPDC001530 TaxID=3364582 RepID=UPI003692BBEA